MTFRKPLTGTGNGKGSGCPAVGSDGGTRVEVTGTVPAVKGAWTMPGARPLGERIGRRPAIAPSLLLCDFGCLEKELERLHQAEVDLLHLDVMDGHFVPNLTYGPLIVQACRRLSDLPLDVHLMIQQPQRYLRAFQEAGADALTIHIEAVPQPQEVLAEIRALGMAAGLACNPSTPVERIRPYLDHCDLVLVMSVEPGFGGQQFQPVALEKLRALRPMAAKALLSVDGGIDSSVIASVVQAGADLCAIGSAIFRAPSYRQAVQQLRAAAGGSGTDEGRA